MSTYVGEPKFKYLFVTTTAGTINADPRDCQRVIDKRNTHAQPQTVWEIRVNGVIRRFWPEEIVSFDMEAV